MLLIPFCTAILFFLIVVLLDSSPRTFCPLEAMFDVPWFWVPFGLPYGLSWVSRKLLRTVTAGSILETQ